MKSTAIRCSACGQEAFLVREPVFEGLKKAGETLKCSACGHVYPREADVPFVEADRVPDLFSPEDRGEKPDLFSDDKPRFCRHCVHYVANPFRQWCGLHRRDVQATDTCPSFAPGQGDG